MIAKKGSLNLTVVGDWNKLYTDPVKLSGILFSLGENDVEIEMLKSSDELILRCKHQGVMIIPDREKMTIVCENFEEATKKYFSEISRAFFRKIPSPLILAYGINIEYQEEQNEHTAELMDAIVSNMNFGDIRLLGGTIKLNLKIDDTYFNCRISSENNSQVNINNDHRINSNSESVILADDFLERFLAQCNRMITAFGYAAEVFENDK